jgi:Mitochondrial carrier protein
LALQQQQLQQHSTQTDLEYRYYIFTIAYYNSYSNTMLPRRNPPSASQRNRTSMSSSIPYIATKALLLLAFFLLLADSTVVRQHCTVQASAVHSTTYHNRNLRQSSNRRRIDTSCADKTVDDEFGFLWGTGTMSTPDITLVRPCSSSAVIIPRSIGNTLLRGALLRIASDLSGGTPLENIKTRVTITTDNMWKVVLTMAKEGGIPAFWTGTSSRTIEGALVGAMFMLGSTVTKRQLLTWGTSRTTAALAGGLVGGVAQAIVMTPAGLIFTALNNNSKNQKLQKKSGRTTHTSETAIQIVRRVVAERGILGMYAGMKPMCIRQATNWASRAGFTEIARASLHLSQYGILGEIAAGTIGGVGSCWNTPIETIRVYIQRDVNLGIQVQSMPQYWNAIVSEYGYPGLFRGITPRAIQAIWQTVFLVVVPNLMGL